VEVKIQMDDALFFDLENCAKELQQSTSSLIEKAVSAYFDKLDEVISDRRMDDIKAGKTELYSLDEVAKKLGLENV